MEKLNILDILKDKPKYTKLWSPIFGECTFDKITCDGSCVGVETKRKVPEVFYANGKYDDDGECTIFPSKQMRDWEKFAWKKGDVLVKDSTCVCVFKEWNNDKYTSIKCKYIKYMDAGSYAEDKVYITDDFHLASQEEKDAYISSIEEHYGGKLNLSTLEIDKQPEFKDGDIVFSDCNYRYNNSIFIIKRIENGNIYYSPSITFYKDHYGDIDFKEYKCFINETLRLATNSERHQLFDALAKKGKAWDAEKKAIVDLPKKCEFKPMDYFMAKDKNDSKAIWILYQYAFICKERKRVYMVNGDYMRYDLFTILPYNDQTKHLLGTTDEWKGGDG